MNSSELLPHFLDRYSFGAAVLAAQKHLRALHLVPYELPLTGVHDDDWLQAVRSLQTKWKISADGGMGPEFRDTFWEKTDQIFAESYLIPGPTVWYGPNALHASLHVGRKNQEEQLGSCNHVLGITVAGSFVFRLDLVRERMREKKIAMYNPGRDLLVVQVIYDKLAVNDNVTITASTHFFSASESIAALSDLNSFVDRNVFVLVQKR